MQLEKDKQSITLDVTNDRYACETFALNIFKRADKVDRAARADVNTSKAFYAASIFIEVRGRRATSATLQVLRHSMSFRSFHRCGLTCIQCSKQQQCSNQGECASRKPAASRRGCCPCNPACHIRF